MIAQYRPSLAKNVVRRSLRGIIDPHPTSAAIDRLWEHFDSLCAYCGRKVGILSKDAHIDHLEAGHGGGANHISNRVLACAECNEKEKREIPWKEFLKQKASGEQFAIRLTRIESWLQLAADEERSLVPDKVLRQVEEEIDSVIQRFDQALIRIRQLRDSEAKKGGR